MNKKSILIRTLCATTLLTVALAGAGCASVFNGGNRRVAIDSIPTGAVGTVTNANDGSHVRTDITPFVVTMDPKRSFFTGQSYNLKLEFPGHPVTNIPLKSSLSGWYFVNLPFANVIGLLIVDPATGAMWNISPDQTNLPAGASVDVSKNRKVIVVKLASQVTEAEKAAMVRVN